MEEYFIESGRKRKGIWKECEQCKEQFISRADWNNKYCGRKCVALSKRKAKVIVECRICGKPTEKSQSRINASKSGLFFCGRKHKEYAQSLEGGVTEIQPAHYGTGSGINTYRSRALLEYGEKCKVCGYDEYIEGLQVHHIDHNRKNNDITNLIVLCGTDHLLVHKGIILV